MDPRAGLDDDNKDRPTIMTLAICLHHYQFNGNFLALSCYYRVCTLCNMLEFIYRGADKSLARQEGNKLQRQKILMFIYPIYNHDWRNISNIYTCNKTSIKRIL
jgi:hypothetical protein